MLKNVKVSVKLQLVSLLLAIVSLGAIVYLNSQISALRIQRDIEERAGMDALLPAFDIEGALVKKQVAQALGRSTSALDEEIAVFVSATASGDQVFKKELVTSEDKKAMEGKWEAASSASTGNVEDAIKALEVYQKAVGDASDLILDPELDTYYLMSSLVVTLPPLNAQLGKAQKAAIVFAKTKNESSVDFNDLDASRHDVVVAAFE